MLSVEDRKIFTALVNIKTFKKTIGPLFVPPSPHPTPLREVANNTTELCPLLTAKLSEMESRIFIGSLSGPYFAILTRLRCIIHPIHELKKGSVLDETKSQGFFFLFLFFSQHVWWTIST